MYRLFILLIFILSHLLAQKNNDEIEYIIYTSQDLKESADILSDYYNDPLNYGYPENNEVEITLNTEVITSNNVLPENLNSYLYTNYADINGNFENLEYLLIIGDEDVIEPYKFQNIAPSDDYFSSRILSINTFPIPKLKTGRILSDNNYDATIIINNIINYINNPTEGSWKGESLLISDDLHKNGKQIYEELVHTEYSNIVYEKLKNNMLISCLYGNDFTRQESSDWYIQPELNNQIIQRINQGLSLVNYIGHGTSNILADEDILTYSDINLLSIENNKLPIWVVGTCSFGNYLNQNCFAEQILKKGDVAIAVISTTYNVSYDNNWSFVNNFYDNLQQYLNYENEYDRIGDIFFHSKNTSGDNYIFHLFGDPAMPMSIAKASNNLTSEINNIDIATFNTINVNNNELSTIKINFEGEENIINYYDQDDVSQFFSYSTPGDILFYDAFYNYTEFILPLNININNLAQIKLHNDFENLFQTITDINLSFTNQSNFNNIQGPNISITHKDKPILNGDIIYPPYNIKIIIEDDEPINLSGLNNNNVRIWIDNNDNSSIILNNYFVPTNNDIGYSGYINFNLNEQFELNSNHDFKIQAWDILGENNVLDINLNIFENNEIYNVYNFPNPFNDETYFTFHYSNSGSLNAIIDIFTLDGKKIKTLSETNLQALNNTFYKLSQSWDGTNKNNYPIAKGTYLYRLTIYLSSNGNKIHDKIYKITKTQ